MIRRALIAALLAAACLPAGAGAVDAFLAFTASTRSASARFDQQVFDRDGRVVERSSGTFAFLRPGRFLWAYDKPMRTVIVADGTRLWLYDEDLNQVTVKTMDRALSATPAALLAGREDVTAAFTLREAPREDGLEWLEAIPKAKDTGFERVRIGFRSGKLAAMNLVDALGGSTALQFADVDPGAKLDAGAFRFTPPRGADVIDESAPAPARER